MNANSATVHDMNSRPRALYVHPSIHKVLIKHVAGDCTIQRATEEAVLDRLDLDGVDTSELRKQLDIPAGSSTAISE